MKINTKKEKKKSTITNQLKETYTEKKWLDQNCSTDFPIDAEVTRKIHAFIMSKDNLTDSQFYGHKSEREKQR